MAGANQVEQSNNALQSTLLQRATVRQSLLGGSHGRCARERIVESEGETAECYPQATMSQLFLLTGAVRRDPAIDDWLCGRGGELGVIAQRWFEAMRDCGDDVRELLHDGHPTACVGNAAFAYVAAFRAHVNVGFFRGAALPDPDGLLEGTGRFMRHVKLGPGRDVDAAALMKLIAVAYTDMQSLLERG